VPVLPVVPLLAFVSRPDAVVLPSLSSEAVLLTAALALSFLVPVTIAALLLADGERAAPEGDTASATSERETTPARTVQSTDRESADRESTDNERAVSNGLGRSER
jgi:hypothetical protein